MRRPTVHHRKPVSLGGLDDDRNTVTVSEKKHQSWHTVFQNKTAHQICREINDVWLDPDFKFLIISEKDAYDIQEAINKKWEVQLVIKRR